MEYDKAVYCHPAYLTHAEHIMWNAWPGELQTRINAKRMIKNLSNADDTTWMAESEEELKRLSMKLKKIV